MKSLRYIVAAAIACASLGLASQVRATIIDLGITTGEPASIKAEFDRLTAQIDLYNASHDPDLDPAIIAGAVEVDTPTGPTSITVDVTGFCYIKLKWDGKDQFYFVGDDPGLQTFNSTVFNRGNGSPEGLSHYVLYHCEGQNVPDSGTTAMLLGTALTGLGFARRYLKR
jgi:VPDSG-CTERM motif